MRKRSVLTLMLSLLVLTTGCSRLVPEEQSENLIYTTFYPLYTVAAALTEGTDVQVACLVSPQSDCFRSYSLSDWDMALLERSASGVIAFGAGMEAFSDALRGLSESGIWLAEVLDADRLANGPGGVSADDESDHFTGVCPYSYLSIDGAKELVQSVAAILEITDDTHADIYAANASVLSERFNAVEIELSQVAGSVKGTRTAILNEALIYPATDLGLSCVTYFARESGSDLYDDELESCKNILREAEVALVLIEEQAPATLITELEAAGYRVARMDTLGLYTESDGAGVLPDVLIKNAQAVEKACLK